MPHTLDRLGDANGIQGWSKGRLGEKGKGFLLHETCR
jgi:hypothetical protein